MTNKSSTLEAFAGKQIEVGAVPGHHRAFTGLIDEHSHRASEVDVEFTR